MMAYDKESLQEMHDTLAQIAAEVRQDFEDWNLDNIRSLTDAWSEGGD